MVMMMHNLRKSGKRLKVVIDAKISSIFYKNQNNNY